MYTLVLSSAYNLEVALIKDDKLIKTTSSDDKKADNYMKMIDTTLAEFNIRLGDIDQIAVNIGPGSFTGIRVAVAIVKGLGFAKKIKYYTFTSFDTVTESKVNIVLSGFSNFVYVKFKDGQMQCVEIGDLPKVEKYITNSIELCSKLKENNLDVEYISSVKYTDVLTMAHQVQNAHQIMPLYLRKSQAEITLDEKLKRDKNEN